MLYLLIILATLSTALISGLFSMAGGMILMGVFGFILSVPAAMVLHGVAQTFSNGSRIWIYRRDVRWWTLLPYSLGALLVLAVFVAVSFVPPIGLVFLLIGIFPFVALRLPESINLNMERPAVAVFCGVIVTLAQMLAGASGPILDAFYNRSNLTRQEILGTKAVTQTFGHILKLGYYALLIGAASNEIPVWLVPAVVVAAIGGNYLASFLVMRITDHQFRRVGRYLILVIGVIYIGKGVFELMPGIAG